MGRWQGQRVLVVGIARQGIALARYLVGHGADVILNDRRPAEEMTEIYQALADLSKTGQSVSWVLGGHPMEILEAVDCICVSGGVPLTIPLLVEAQLRGIPLTNDSQIFLEAAPCKVIGITGSAGKTTTTSLVGEMASASQTEGSPFSRVWVGGNIGNPLLSVVDEMQVDDLAVMELSSFQLEMMTRSPQVAAVLNITPNHLDRHDSMQSYTAAKARILDYQPMDGIAILGRDDPGAWSLAERTRGDLLSFGLTELPPGQEGCLIREERIFLRRRQPSGDWAEQECMPRAEIFLRGEHHLQNVMAACAVASAVGLPLAGMRQAASEFRGVEHRLQFVRSWRGVDWYNDSIATAPERAIAAIRSFDEPLVILAGGRDKNLPWEDFARLVCQRADRLILFGEAAGKISDAVGAARRAVPAGRLKSVSVCPGLKQAVAVAAELVQPGDVVLLSPGCTSFDQFKDFEERGKCFVQWVNDLR